MNKNKSGLIYLLKRLKRFLSPTHYRKLNFLLGLMIVSAFFEVLSVGAIIPFIAILTSPETLFSYGLIDSAKEFFSITSPQQLIIPVVVCFSLAALMAGFVRVILLWAQTRISYSIGVDLSVEVYRKTLYQPYLVHVSRNTSEVISAVAVKTANLANTVILPLVTILSALITLFVLAGGLIIVKPTIALLSFFGFTFIYFVVVLGSKRKLLFASACVNEEQNAVFKELQEGLGGIREVLLDGSQELHCEVYRLSDTKLRRSLGNVHILSSAPRYIVEALAMVLVALLAYGMFQYSDNFADKLVILGAFAMGALKMLPQIQQIYVSWSSIKGSIFALEDVVLLLEQPLPKKTKPVDIRPLSFSRRLDLKNIYFAYDDQKEHIIKNINLSIPVGAKVGIIGESGGGKSTLVDMLLGLLKPDSGQLLVDGIAVNEMNQQSWQSNIGHVPQSIYLFDSSVAENVALNTPIKKIDYHRLEIVLRAVQLGEVIDKWPKGVTTKIGERGSRLSGGQRQRIGIARALYKKPKILILDEATSALDQKTEQRLVERLNSFCDDLTLVMIAHRLSTLKNCDMIFEVKKGNISPPKSYEKIIAENNF